MKHKLTCEDCNGDGYIERNINGHDIPFDCSTCNGTGFEEYTIEELQKIYDSQTDENFKDILSEQIEELRDKERELKSVYVPNMEDYQ